MTDGVLVIVLALPGSGREGPPVRAEEGGRGLVIISWSTLSSRAGCERLAFVAVCGRVLTKRLEFEFVAHTVAQLLQPPPKAAVDPRGVCAAFAGTGRRTDRLDLVLPKLVVRLRGEAFFDCNRLVPH